MRKKELNNKMKEGMAEVEKYTYKHLVETLTVLAILMATFSGWMHFFIGTMGWSILFLAIGGIAGLFAPVQMDAIVTKIYSFSKGRSRPAVIGTEVIKIAIALFFPFIYFCFMGIMSGTAFQYYIHTSRSSK
ncbi:MAG TPA: hypothetical protein VLE96_05000, partial [Chlamydiales bacterium]|nr:hypothetical protein [Chlamydiales bacterium]